MSRELLFIEGILFWSFFLLVLIGLTISLKRKRSFLPVVIMYGLFFICSLLDASWILIFEKEGLVTLNKILYLVFMSAYSFIGYCWAIHIIKKVDKKKLSEKYKLSICLLVFPIFMTVANIILNINGNGKDSYLYEYYSKNVLNLFTLTSTYGFFAIASLLCFMRIKHAKNKEERNELIVMASFVIPIMICGVVERFISVGIPITYFGVCLSGTLYYVVVLKNRTKDAERLIQDELRESLRKAEASNASKTNFLLNMSHDIRTPMNSVLGFSNIAKKNINVDKNKAMDALDKLESSGLVLLSMINEILDMSKVETGQVIIEEKPCDLKELNKEIYNLFSSTAEEKEIKFAFTSSNIHNKYVYTDIFNLKRSLGNIINNAIKYTNPGGKIEIICSQDDTIKYGYGQYKYVIHDTGIGISSEFIDSIFDKFSKETNTTNSGLQGAGLGLSIAKKLIELMGGTITVESEVGLGSSFIVEIPLRILDNPKEYVEGTMNIAYDFVGRRVLLAEDNKLNREIAHHVLEEEGIVVEDAKDGLVALDMFKLNGYDYYDLIFMDIQMPNMDGYEATRAIRQYEEEMGFKHRVPIIAMTANAFEEDRKNALDAGMDEHITKPIKFDEVINVISKTIDK